MLERLAGKASERAEGSEIFLDLGRIDNGQRPEEDVFNMLRFSYENGVNTVYCSDWNEKSVEFAGSFPDFGLALATHAQDAGGLERELEGFLRASRRKSIFLVVLYNLTDEGDWRNRDSSGVVKLLDQLEKKGTIESIGVHGTNISLLNDLGNQKCIDYFFTPYHVRNTIAESLFASLHKRGKQTVATDPYQEGLLRDFPELADNNLFKEDFLRFILSNDAISHVLVDADSVDDCWTQIRASHKPPLVLNEQKLLKETAEKKLGRDYCRGCMQCLPCDEHGWKFNIELIQWLERRFHVYDDRHAREEYGHLEMDAKACTKCMACEARCPYDIPVVKRLFEADEQMGG